MGDQGGLIKYGLDPQEGPMREGRIETAEEDPSERARVVTMARGEREELILDSVRGSWTSYYQNIADVLIHGAEPAVKPQEALKTMRVYDAAMASAAFSVFFSVGLVTQPPYFEFQLGFLAMVGVDDLLQQPHNAALGHRVPQLVGRRTFQVMGLVADNEFCVWERDAADGSEL